ncbi:MAG: NADH-quinone oxidoreductase subunit M [Deltaproteobacteria bacterium]|nr:NADH-quinone oxidoreductase subunit M [Deltaproteobacteria bacterium]
MSFPILSLLLALPLAGAAAVALLPREQKDLARALGLLISLAVFAVSVVVYLHFDPASAAFQFEEKRAWIPETIHYHVGVDGISLLLVMLTTALSPLVLLGAWRAIEHRVKEFVIAYLFLETGMLGSFLAIDLFLFYVAWEFMLIPMYLIIGVWGGPRRILATVKFVLYTMVGSLLMLVGILYLHVKTGATTFSYTGILELLTTAEGQPLLSVTEQALLFLAFGLAFAIKVPLFPFHTWLPDAHVEAPTPGSVVLAGVLLKLGTYGFLRFCIPFFPHAAALASWPIMALAVTGILYGSLVAYAQTDIKKLVAYSSVAHLGFVMLGMFTLTPEGVSGALLQMVNHGFSTGALFLCVGFLYERRHTREIPDFGGLARVMPVFAAVFLLVTFSSIGVPGTNGFVGEFLILTGVFREGVSAAIEPGTLFSWRNLVLAFGFLATGGIILGAVYMLSMVRRVMHGPLTRDENRSLRDLSAREIAVMLPLLAMILAIGLGPNLFLSKTRASVQAWVQRYQDPVMEVRAPATAARNRASLLEALEQHLGPAASEALRSGGVKVLRRGSDAQRQGGR